MKHIKLAIITSFMALSTTIYATSDITFDGVTQHEISINTSANETSLAKQRWKKAIKQVIELNKQKKKTIALMNVSLSAKAKHTLKSKIDRPKYSGSTAASTEKTAHTLPSHIQLGMNDVPVLDQGVHGTCTTFAVTATLDAIGGKGDFYSQLCLLNLGKHLARYGYNSSGWEGLDIGTLLARINEFGLISKATQENAGCGGSTAYPVHEQDTSSSISIEDYNAMSMPSYYSGLSATSSILDVKKWINRDLSDAQLLAQVKEALYAGNRIVIAALLPITENLGASGKFHAPNDTWMLTGELEQAIKLYMLEESQWGGHAMVITGYDDDAVVTDSQGVKHQGLFTLRNSWSEAAGDRGNYYMTYDYLTMLAISLTEAVSIKK